MGRSRLISAAVASTLTLGIVGTGAAVTVVAAAPAGAATPSAWGGPAALTEAGVHHSVHDVRITANGTAVAVWSRDAGHGDQELWSATRPAQATAWSAPVLVAATKGEVYSAELTAGTDGSATVAWHHWGGSGYTLSSSTLLAGAASWTPAAQVSTVAHPAGYALASGPGGRLVAVWGSFGDPAQGDATRGLYVSERPAPGAAWSAPVKLSDVLALTPAATVGPDGTVTVAWADDFADDRLRVRITSLAPGATAWETPRGVEGTDSALVGDLTLQSSASGATLLSWSEGRDTHRFAYRPAAGAPWGASETAPSDGRPYASGTPQLGPDGAVTALWKDFSALRTATRSAAGAWSAPHTLTESYVGGIWSPSVGGDGTVTALWTGGDGELTVAQRTGGAWGRPLILGRIDAAAGRGHSATGTDGRAVVLWNRTTGTTDKGAEIHQVWGAATLPPAPKPPTAAKHRDHVGGDGLPDLYAQSATGALTVYRGTTAGTVSTRVGAGTWPADTTFVPFGDLDADGANDTLVRTAAGDLLQYSPPRGQAVTPELPHTRIGTGFTDVDALTYSGDFNGDALPDLVARQTATGDLLLYTGTAHGTLSAGVRIGTKWKGLTIVGAGDLNNDKNADLLARTATGDLYRYNGTGKGTIGDGAKIGSRWGAIVDFVGIGDLSGDGNADILGRHTTGDLYRYNGTGKGAIGDGTKIGTGWKSFTGIR
ncbi:FG-GAP-like repeat-containing protein [Streptomyces sp. NPDC045431]|uniref:FG-GAP-like repeat-containing protein n=1 Tax=Streptomyces sp. NPDC045431 TaxID=3155613 RepID=UPI00340B6F4C